MACKKSFTNSFSTENLTDLLTNEMFTPFQLDNSQPFRNEPLKIQELEQLFNNLTHEPKKMDPLKLLNCVLSREIFIDVLNSIQEGVQIVDCKGTIRYVNPAFLNIVGVKLEERIGKNISAVSPDGGLAKVLKTGKPIANLRNKPKGSLVELVSSAMPIFLFDQMIGAIAFVQDIRDLISLTEKLKQSNCMVDTLSQKISYLGKAKYTFDDLIGSSVEIQNVVEMAKIAAQNEATVLIHGETGTGKEVIANAIHKASARSKKSFISVNCSAIPSNLLESEFFGHEKGSFTGAYKTKLGKFELANGGTIFLDEIGDMDLALQAKILRVLQEKEIQRVGGEIKLQLDVRVIAATNRNLKKMIAEGTFREDLYYRLNVWNIFIPPLRDRKVDLEVLADYLMKKLCRRLGRKPLAISNKAIDLMYKYHWPGNVRELENVIERAILNSRGKLVIEPKDLQFITENSSPIPTD